MFGHSHSTVTMRYIGLDAAIVRRGYIQLWPEHPGTVDHLSISLHPSRKHLRGQADGRLEKLGDKAD